MEHFYGHGLGFPGGGAVADGDVLHGMLAHKAGENGDGLLLLLFAEGGVHHGGSQHLAGGIDHGYLAAVAVSGVKTHSHKSLYRGLHQKGLEVQCEIVDGAGVGPFGKVAADFTLEGGEDKSLICILRSSPDESGHMGGGFQSSTADAGSALVTGEGHIGFQEAFLFTTIHGQDLMVQQPGNGGAEFIIQPINAVFFRVLCMAGKNGLAIHQFP